MMLLYSSESKGNRIIERSNTHFRMLKLFESIVHPMKDLCDFFPLFLKKVVEMKNEKTYHLEAFGIIATVLRIMQKQQATLEIRQ